MTKFQNNNGFSLVEILIGLALAGGLSLLGMQLFKQQTTGQRTVEANYEVASIVQQIKTVLSDPSNCASSLQGLNPASGVPVVLKKEVGSLFENVYALNTQLPGNIKITSYSLSKAYPALASNETMLRINFSRGTNTLKDQTLKNLKIVYTVNGSGNILTCYAFNNNSDTYWIQSLIQPDDIYYMAGRVGVGVADPVAKFEVTTENSGENLYVRRFQSPGGGANIKLFSASGSSTVPGTIGMGGVVGYLDFHAYVRSGGSNAYVGLGQIMSLIDQVDGTGQAGAALVFKTGSGLSAASSEKMRITSTGNVGLGTASPGAKLHVFGGDVYLTDQNINNFSSARSAYTLRTDNITAASDSGVRLYDGNTQGHLHIGNAGISYLQSYGTSSISPSVLGTSSLDYDDSGNFSNLFINPLGGNVGVGTTAPVAKLDVNGPIKVGSAADLCDASIAGQQRYKSDIKVMQYCNGTSWVSMNGGGLDYTPLTDSFTWSVMTLSTTGGSGVSSGSPSISLAALGGYDCGPLTTVGLSATGMTSSTKAALVSFASFDSSEPSPAARVFTTGNQFVGLVGQAGRGGDGRSFGAGGEMVIPLNGQQFRIQFCKNSSSATFYYAVKAILN